MDHDLLRNFIIVPLHFVNINDNEYIKYISTNSLVKTYSLLEYPAFTDVISGNFAQNDIRFNEYSRDRQSITNSVVFLAFAYFIKENFRCEDIDSILMLGDHIFTVCYTEAIKKKPRNEPFLFINEVKEEIYVNINRFKIVNYNVVCQALLEKQYSGNLNEHIKKSMELFFQNYNNGILTCSLQSIAVHKSKNKYLLFDQLARSVEGFKQVNGKANLFVFSSTELIIQFLCRLGYNKSYTFALTPFSINCDKEFNISQTVDINTSNEEITNINIENMIPISNEIYDMWDSDDDTPLIELRNSVNLTQKINKVVLKSMMYGIQVTTYH